MFLKDSGRFCASDSQLRKITSSINPDQSEASCPPTFCHFTLLLDGFLLLCCAVMEACVRCRHASRVRHPAS